jgi:hypothetical protein
LTTRTAGQEKIMALETDGQRQAYIALRQLNTTDPKWGGDREWVPAWSSWGLEQTIEKIVGHDGSGLRDVFAAFWELAGQPDVRLTRWMVNFILDIVRLCFRRYRQRYDAEDFLWMAERVQRGCTPSQAYLALMALPPDFKNAACRSAILSSLKGTEFLEKAERMLAPDL